MGEQISQKLICDWPRLIFWQELNLEHNLNTISASAVGFDSFKNRRALISNFGKGHMNVKMTQRRQFGHKATKTTNRN